MIAGKLCQIFFRFPGHRKTQFDVIQNVTLLPFDIIINVARIQSHVTEVGQNRNAVVSDATISNET